MKAEQRVNPAQRVKVVPLEPEDYLVQVEPQENVENPVLEDHQVL